MKLFPTRCQPGSLIILLLFVLALSACQPITRPVPSAAPLAEVTDPEQIPGLAAAQELLAQELKVDATAITVVSTEAVEWPDACLGAAGPDEMCAGVITPGVKVIFKAGDGEYEYRLSADGSQQRPAPAP